VLITRGVNTGLDFVGVVISNIIGDIVSSINIGGLSRRGLTSSTERGLKNTATWPCSSTINDRDLVRRRGDIIGSFSPLSVITALEEISILE
jgi:hypothetical protein